MEDNGTGLLKRTRGMGLCSGEPQISRMDADDSGAAERPLGGQLDRALEEDGAQFWPDDVSLIGESASDC